MRQSQGSSQLRSIMELAIARYRLLFKHPFGTAHGLRDGTDSVFVRLADGDQVGFGEATLPPYLNETQDTVIQEIRSNSLNVFISEANCSNRLPFPDDLALSSPARASLTTAYYDLIAKQLSIGISEILEVGRCRSRPETMVTLGHTDPSEIASKLKELPNSKLLKVKLGSHFDKAALEALLDLDDRPFFLDANQGWSSVEQALEAIALVGVSRVRGIEQPFPKDRWDLHRELKRRTEVPVFGDESIQDLADLEQAAEAFSGVNLKLMKCGGLDRALKMARRAKELGLEVMLGSMSESTLGCGAMAALNGCADLADLDGPWLIQNDPFQGLSMINGELKVSEGYGIGVRPRNGFDLDWTNP